MFRLVIKKGMEWYLFNFVFKFFIVLIVYKFVDFFGILKNYIIYS